MYVLIVRQRFFPLNQIVKSEMTNSAMYPKSFYFGLLTETYVLRVLRDQCRQNMYYGRKSLFENTSI